MKIGVIADTHIPEKANKLPEKIYEVFKGVDLILFAGDLVELEVLDELKKLAKVEAVCGNMDYQEVTSALPSKKTIEVQGKRIGLIHGLGAPWDLPERVRTEFKNVDAIVFGHTHEALNEVWENVLLFNPGSPTDKVFAKFNSFGMLYVDEKGIRGEIIRL